jgi:hypothetical protein
MQTCSNTTERSDLTICKGAPEVPPVLALTVKSRDPICRSAGMARTVSLISNGQLAISMPPRTFSPYGVRLAGQSNSLKRACVHLRRSSSPACSSRVSSRCASA